MTLGNNNSGPVQGFGQGMMVPPGGKSGDGNWQDYTDFRKTIFEPIVREINDRFKYVDLGNDDLRQLISQLVSLGAMQLTASCNQHTNKVRKLQKERDAIMFMLTNSGLPHYRLEFDDEGNLLTLIPNPNFVHPSDQDEDEDEALSDEEKAERIEPEFLPELPMGIFEEFLGSRDEMAKDYPEIWYVPMTPSDCWDRLVEISETIRDMQRERVASERDNVFWDSAPLLDDLAEDPEVRISGDVTWMYPFFYREAFAVAAITIEDLHGHIQAVNSTQMQQRFGGNSFNPNSMMPTGWTQPEQQQPTK